MSAPTVRRLAALALLLLALGLRIGYVERQPFQAVNDAGTYNHMASMVAQTGDYQITGAPPGHAAGGSYGPTAYFPPAFPYLLALADLIDGHPGGLKGAIHGERIEMAILGTVTVGLIGLVALEAFGPAVALSAMGLAAIYPAFIELSGTLVAENLLAALEMAALWAILRARRSPHHPYPWIALGGVLTGLCALTHENAILYAIPFSIVAWAAAWRLADHRRQAIRALAAPALLVLVLVAMIEPWTLRNQAVMGQFIPISDETGITLVGTYNPVSAANRIVPWKWVYYAKLPEYRRLAHHARQYTEPQLGAILQHDALQYISHHPGAPLSVAEDNLLRLLELEGRTAWQASARAIGLTVPVARWGVTAFWVLGLLALGGVGTRRLRAGPAWLWTLPVLYALSIIFVNVETPRFREPIDAFLILAAACLVSSLLDRLRSGLRRAPVRGRRRAPEVAAGGERVEMVERLP